MSEQDYQAKVMLQLRVRGCYVVNVVTASKAGVSDILACCPVTDPESGIVYGQFEAHEVKLSYNALSELQLENHEQVKQAGGKAFARFKPRR